ncbi:RES family NAD+ phosphorylase [Duganella sp. FT27W]|uniref:RES family NAD+ phosphorylase n=1 Tax=Duganella sp. FT27W TaxID=2654636 RepID=UPI00186B8C2E|nr:RES family NAD+ phosphorylase [Duganella sp. FT27W]
MMAMSISTTSWLLLWRSGGGNVTALPIAPPPRILSTEKWRASRVLPQRLYRISGYSFGEPYFGRSGGNRFDAPGWKFNKAEYGACYLGYTLEVAMAESILHDQMPIDGKFLIANTVLQNSYVYRFTGDSLLLLNLTGALLKKLSGHGDLTGTSSYGVPQQWALAVFNNPARYDGFIYASRHATLGKAVMLFDRAEAKITQSIFTPLIETPGYAKAAKQFAIVGM